MEIVWSRLGERLFKSVLEYVGDNFRENVARQTFHRITEKVEQLLTIISFLSTHKLPHQRELCGGSPC